MSYIPLQELHRAIIRAGNPVAGVTFGTPPSVNGWKTQPTEAQKASASDICSTFNMAPRNRKTADALQAEIQALSTSDKIILANAIEARMIDHGAHNQSELGAIIGDTIACATLKGDNFVTAISKQKFLLVLAMHIIQMFTDFCKGLGMAAPVNGSELA